MALTCDEITDLTARDSRPAIRDARLISLIARLKTALEDIALLDEADGHELQRKDAYVAVAIATKALGLHPSQIYANRNASAVTK